MKKFILLIILLFPFGVFADGKVISHLIDAEIEIAGALNVKELVVVEGNNDFLSRTLNYYSFGDKAWDGKDVNLNDGTIYNGQSVSILNISAYEFTDAVEFGSFDKNVTNYFTVFDIKKPSDNTYTFIDNKDGTASLKIFHKSTSNKTAYYINYVITNVVVKHNDVKEINYTFKNLNYKTNENFLRVIIPYQTDDELYHVWVHGNQKGEVQELVSENDLKAGIVAKFPIIKNEVNFRMTLPEEQVGIDVYLNKSGIDALDEIIKIENNRLNQTNKSNKIINIMHYVLIIMAILYLLSSILIIKYYTRELFIIYLLFGIFIIIFNYLFRFNLWYLYLTILLPLIIKIIKKYFIK